MPFYIVREDLTKMRCDAIVTPADSSLSGGGGLDAAIHKAAGAELDAACRAAGRCPVGDAAITAGYGLSCKYLIHAVGPVWTGGGQGEETLLRQCYRRSLALADDRHCESIALPLISAGNKGYPREAALRVAESEIERFLQSHEMEVYLVVYDRSAFLLGRARFADLREYIDERYVEAHPYRRGMTAPLSAPCAPCSAAPRFEPLEDMQVNAVAPELRRLLQQMDESFSQMLLRKIDEKGMTDAECYKKANVDRKLFSKIRSDPQYKTRKTTALAFAVALELDMDETRELLSKAGFALSRSSRFDVIVEYFIERGIYDIFEINEALFAFDQSLLGS